MKQQGKANWVLLTLVTGIALFIAAHNLLPQPKARAQRIQAVNRITSVSFTFLMTNVPADIPSKK